MFGQFCVLVSFVGFFAGRSRWKSSSGGRVGGRDFGRDRDRRDRDFDRDRDRRDHRDSRPSFGSHRERDSRTGSSFNQGYQSQGGAQGGFQAQKTVGGFQAQKSPGGFKSTQPPPLNSFKPNQTSPGGFKPTTQATTTQQSQQAGGNVPSLLSMNLSRPQGGAPQQQQQQPPKVAVGRGGVMANAHSGPPAGVRPGASHMPQMNGGMPPIQNSKAPGALSQMRPPHHQQNQPQALMAAPSVASLGHHQHMKPQAQTAQMNTSQQAVNTAAATGSSTDQLQQMAFYYSQWMQQTQVPAGAAQVTAQPPPPPTQSYAAPPPPPGNPPPPPPPPSQSRFK